MRTYKEEKTLMNMTYLLCIALFTNLAFINGGVDKGAIIMGVLLCILIGYSHFVIRKFFPEGDKFILIFAFILSVIGVAILYRLSPDTAINQLMYVVVGITVFMLMVVMLPDLKSFAKYRYVYMIITLIFMPMALLIGTEIYGSKNWVKLGPISFQPSEFAKIALVFYLASVLMNYVKKKDSKEEVRQLLEPGLVVLFSLGCMVLQKDLGSALMFFGISVTMLYLASENAKYVIVTLIFCAVGAVISYFLFDHLQLRVRIWLDPWKYENNDGYQLVQGFYSMASGGMFGSGLGQGYPQFVPVNTSDFIFVVICEEMGMTFGIGVMMIFFLLFYRGIRTALVAEDRFSQLVAGGLSSMIACQVLVIIGGVMGAIPLTGITLPLISAGGTSVLTIFFALGILQKISEGEMKNG